MTKFTANRDTFMSFVADTECKGIMDVNNNAKVKAGSLYGDFLLTAKDNEIRVDATDTKINKVIAQHVFHEAGTTIDEEGTIPITSVPDFIKAMGRLGAKSKKKEDKNLMMVQYPYENTLINVSKVGTDTAWAFPTAGEGMLKSQESITSVIHKWAGDHVEGFSKSQNKRVPWPYKLTVVPSEIKEIASDMKDFTKSRTVHASINPKKVVFFLGTVQPKHGARELMQWALFKYANWQEEGPEEGPKTIVPGSGAWEPVPDDMPPIEANYFHGFYAVLQNLSDDLATELHFININGGWMCWIHAASASYDLNYMVPFDSGEKKGEEKPAAEKPAKKASKKDKKKETPAEEEPVEE